jgi:hypothetical protein
MDPYVAYQGSALIINAVFYDDDDLVAPYDGASVLETTVWPGGNRALSFLAPTFPTVPAAGSFSVAIAASVTATLAPGEYKGLTRVTQPGQDPVDGYEFTLTIKAFAGTGAEPKVYCDYADLLRYGRSWLLQLTTADDEAGFAQQRARARSWLEDVAHAHNPTRGGARSVWLTTQLAADALIVRDEIRECVAKKALAFICEAQVGMGEEAAVYARMARMFHSQADGLANSLILEFDRDHDGVADMTIDCTCIRPLYG